MSVNDTVILVTNNGMERVRGVTTDADITDILEAQLRAEKVITLSVRKGPH